MGTDHRRAASVKAERPAYPLWCAIIGLAAFLPYLPGLSGPFRFDDLPNVVQNQALRSASLMSFFTDATVFSIKPGNWPYRPVTLLVNAIQLRLSGVDSAFPWHLFQALIHVANSILVMLVAKRAFGLKRGALAAGLLFALAPIQTSAVLYLSARSVTLALAPALGAILAFVSSFEAEEKKSVAVRLVVTGFLAGLAFLAYEGALALVIWLYLSALASGVSGRDKKLYQRLIPVAVIAGIFLLLRIQASPGELLAGHEAIKPEYTRLQQILIQAQTPLKMAVLFVYPGGLSFFHHPPAPASALDLRVIVGFLGLLACGFVIVIGWKKKALSAGLCWYLAALLPALAVSLNTPWAEHRSYLALPGLVLALGFVLERLEDSAAEISRGRVRLVRVMTVVMLAMMGLAGAARSVVWSSPLGLYQDAVKKTPEFHGSWNLLAAEAELKRSRQKHDNQRPECLAIIRYTERASHFSPGFADAYNTKLNCLVRLGRFSDAETAINKALELDPENPQYRRNLEMLTQIRRDFEQRKKTMGQGQAPR